MSKLRRRILSVRGLAAFGAVVLGGQVAVWATTACQAPNPSTKLCATIPADAVSACSNANPNAGLGCGVSVYETNSFPDGAVSASSGSTKEVQADCQRSQTCKLDSSVQPQKCVVYTAGGWSGWSQAAKTTTGDAQCPTDEG